MPLLPSVVAVVRCGARVCTLWLYVSICIAFTFRIHRPQCVTECFKNNSSGIFIFWHSLDFQKWKGKKKKKKKTEKLYNKTKWKSCYACSAQSATGNCQRVREETIQLFIGEHNMKRIDTYLCIVIVFMSMQNEPKLCNAHACHCHWPPNKMENSKMRKTGQDTSAMHIQFYSSFVWCFSSRVTFENLSK